MSFTAKNCNDRNETETRAELIDPVLRQRGWLHEQGMIKREVSAGAIEIVGGKARRRAQGRADYTLRVVIGQASQPLALGLIEAKRERLHPRSGLQQGRGYAEAKRLNVPFVFATNGHLFVEFDRFTGQTSQLRPLAEFPTPAELQARYEAGMGFALTDIAAQPLLQPYSDGETGRRYYQDAAIRATLEKIARCVRNGELQRALLILATGAGKTFIAVNLLKRLSDAGHLTRALFVCDRDELRTQALIAFQRVFGSDAAEVKSDGSGGNRAKHARIHIATYQTLGIDDDDDASFLCMHYPPDFFSHVVIDECHRSAFGKWSAVLTRNAQAVQIGLTATPRTLKIKPLADAIDLATQAHIDEAAKITADNLQYFGEPVYEYDMAQAMADGYLAFCQIRKGRVNLDQTGLTLEQIMAHNPRDALTGLPVGVEEVRARYEAPSFEDRVMLPDRVIAMCADLFKYLIETGGPEQKTVIFCARDSHADAVAAEMGNLYANWCKTQQRQPVADYAFKCTGKSDGSKLLADFRGADRRYFIATTVDLLTTGVDVPKLRNVVFFRYVRSPINFYQMIGRGTRIDEPSGKLMFYVYDYTNATDLFGAEFITEQRSLTSGLGGDRPPPEPVIMVDGIAVTVKSEGDYVLGQVDGRDQPIALDEYKRRLAAQLLAEAPTLAEFRQRWAEPDERVALLEKLKQGGYPPSALQSIQQMADYDLYDVLIDLGFHIAPRTRQERVQAFFIEHDAWLDGLPAQTAAAIRAIVGQFERDGTAALESRRMFETPAFKAAGGIGALAAGGEPSALIQAAKARMFAV
ncbi:type I restriction enzyme, R subunit [Allochromatium warmingii]|uniref:Type I restriction enzyme, R subunit n=1 Tax=Allochromatium warmingii TaxID=61595 RepID=A0A1H3EBZ7_ALLWA|nr:DEAD/DEAH box helicase family protein [Allochromatium warmingii]SDX76236.1 type I restriction enzyme, R subunit [Allochromatium warmingii]